MRKKVIFFIGILLLCGAGWGYYLYNKPHQSISSIKPDVIIKADDLYKQYSANEGAANHKFLNKIIAVTGSVDEVNKSDSSYTILLKSNGGMGGISCNLFTKNNTGKEVKPNEMVTLKGRCTGFLMDVVLADCVIQ